MRYIISCVLAAAAVVASTAPVKPSFAPPQNCPFPGIKVPLTIAFVVSGDAPTQFLPGVKVEAYQPDFGPPPLFGTAAVANIPNSPVDQQHILLTDATLTFDVGGSSRTRIWYDNSRSANSGKSFQINGQPPYYERHLPLLPDTIGGIKVFHSYQPSLNQKGIIDFVGDIDDLRIGSESFAIEKVCTSSHTCNSIDASLSPHLTQGSISLPRPSTLCIEVTVIGPEDRLVEAVTFEGMKRTFHPQYKISAVIYEVDAKDSTIGVLVADKVASSEPLSQGSLQEGLATLGMDNNMDLITKAPLQAPGSIPLSVTIQFSETLLEVGKTYRIGFGWKSNSNESDFGLQDAIQFDRVDNLTFDYMDLEGLFVMSGAYSSAQMEYPTNLYDLNSPSDTFVPRIRIKTRCR